jgi:hypothetical protein
MDDCKAWIVPYCARQRAGMTPDGASKAAYPVKGSKARQHLVWAAVLAGFELGALLRFGVIVLPNRGDQTRRRLCTNDFQLST